MECKHSAALLAIRQICLSGLAGRDLLPLVAQRLRSVVPAFCCQFTWSSESGRLVNFWSDVFMPRRIAWIILNHRRYEADAGISFHDLVMYGRPTGNLRAWWLRGFEHSATYDAVFRPYGLKWFLDGVVRDGQRPYGVLAMLRRADDPDFTAEEEDVLARALPYLAHALRIEAARPGRFVRGGRSAVLVCDEAGDVLEWSEGAHRLALFALLEQINLDSRIRDDDFAEAREVLREVVRRLAAAIDAAGESDEMPAVVRRNGWGEFVLRGYRLEGGRPGVRRIGVVVEQLVPYESRLLERVSQAPLTARQKDIVLLSARGLTNAEIARHLSISPHTLKDYMKDIYGRLEVNSHRALLERITPELAGGGA